MFLKELAEETGGRYHCYVSTSDVSIQDKWLMASYISPYDVTFLLTVYHLRIICLWSGLKVLPK